MKINWTAYFKEFSLQHGGEPVLWGVNSQTGKGGKLLFRDGWKYALSVEGPEYPPKNKKEQLLLIRTYWTLRSNIFKQQIDTLREEIRELALLQIRMSAPLMTKQEVYVEAEDGGSVKKSEVAPVNYQSMIEDYRDLWDNYRECQKQLENPAFPEYERFEGRNPASVLAEIESIEEEGDSDVGQDVA